MIKDTRPLSRVKTALISRGQRFDILVIVSVVVLLGVAMFLAPQADAQIAFPRLGISASPVSYVDSLEVDIGESFQLYVCAFGNQPGDPLEQEVSVLQWALHQVCCGAVLEVQDVDFNPDFYHEGTPTFGVASSSESCVSAESIVLATLTLTLNAPEPGVYLAAAGPFAPAIDCEGNNPLFMDMPVNLIASGEVTPVESSTWGGLKASYR